MALITLPLLSFLSCLAVNSATALPALGPGSTETAESEQYRRQWEVGQIVDTTSGRVQGTASTLRPDVSAYLGIPFAQPPTGNLRFEAPVPVERAGGVIDATKIGPDCPSNLIPTAHAQDIPSGGGDVLVAVSQHGDVLDEDCLSVNVWTKPQRGEAEKAVLFWIFGGGFSLGNAANAVYDGSILADENDVVVVSANYRTNIFGFPGAPNVTQNVGLLDQRRALEWARDNVAAFGGDPTRITLFGQSAGGASVDFVPFAYPEDPIAHAIIPQSGTSNAVFASSGSSLSVTNNWYRVSTVLGCGGNEAGAATVACMRTKAVPEILTAMTNISKIAIASGFTPVVDNKTVPYDIPTRLATGNFAKLPTLAGNTQNEGGFFLVLWLAYSDVTPQQLASLPPWSLSLIRAFLDVITPYGFTCAVLRALGGRASNSVPAWKYTYFGGNYSNIYVPYVGSDYHTSELPILFGTAASVSNESDSAPEASQGRLMRKAWTAFARDPVNGLIEEMNWPMYSNSTPNVLRIAYGNESEPVVFPDYGSLNYCANNVSSLVGVASSIQQAFAPYASEIAPIEDLIFGLLTGKQIPPVVTDNGDTLTILLSIFQFFAGSFAA